MSRVVLVLAILALTIYCVVDCIQSDENEVRNLPKIVWVLLLVIAPIVGPVAWFVAGRSTRDRPGPGTVRPPVSRRPSAPDDDPTFLAGLDRTNEERRRLEAWERELEARERGPNGSGGPDSDPPRDKREQDGPGDEPATRT